MHKRICWLVFPILMLFIVNSAYGQQQDVDFHINAHLFAGQKILKVKRDFRDPYLWVLAQNNEVYRVNSLTLAVDDYTATFSAYSNFQFIDIAGRSQDTVFIATNSTNVIDYNNGVIKIIGAADGLADSVNSIGISNFSGDLVYNSLQIGTTKGRGQYDIATGNLLYNTYYMLTDDRIYEASYRNFTAKENSYEYYLPSLIPLSIYGIGGGEIADIAPSGESGPNVMTAFGTEPYLISPGQGGVYEQSIFWGNEKGLFEESTSNSYLGSAPYNYYLNGIKVNKITDIWGFTSLGHPATNSKPYSLYDENLLVGTDNGLYFSSSIYGNFNAAGLHTYSMFHYDVLGNTPVNDICVNGTATQYQDTPRGCEDGVWVACENGLYFIKPDYAKYLDPTIRLQAVTCDNIPFPDTSTTVKICNGDTAGFHLTIDIPPGNLVQWVKDDADLPGKTGQDLAVTAPGEYYAIIYASCENVHVETNHFTVQVISGPQFTFNYPDTLQYCDSGSTTLITTNSPSYHYRWYKNDVLNGDTSSALAVNQTGKYKVEVSACTNSWVPSKEVQVNLLSVPEPGISIDKIPYCYGDTAHFTSTSLMDTTAFTLRWYKDNTLLPGLNNQYTIKTVIPGSYTLSITDNVTLCSKVSPAFQLSFTPPPSFTLNYPDVINYCQGSPVTLTAQGDPNYQYRWYRNDTLLNVTTPAITVAYTGKYKVEVSACQNSWAPSKEVQLNFIQVPVPAIITDKPAYCIGDNATLGLSAAPGPLYTINWYKDNVLVPAYNNQGSITTNVAGTYTAVVISNTSSTNGQTCSQTSNAIQLFFNAQPTLTIQQQVNTTLCQGQSVTLKAVHSDGTLKWSTGETSDEINVSASGTYSATLIATSGCTADTSINVAFLNNPVLSIHDTTICTYTKQNVTLTAPAGFIKYTWNDVPGEQTFNVTFPQTVALTVTDANGCQAIQQIHITEQCPDVFIPNTFTPNGDGINDVWDVQGLDATALVRIFDRYGAMIYQSKGYTVAWDGRYRNKKLPAGTYYYIINAKNNTQTFSGPVTILY